MINNELNKIIIPNFKANFKNFTKEFSSYSFLPQSLYRLTGGNGEGKSIYLNHVYSQLKDNYKVQYLNTHSYLFDFSVKKNLNLVAKETDKMNELIDYFNIKNILKQNVHEISTGEYFKTAIIRSLLLDFDILLLDEVDINLDVNSKKLLYNLLSNLAEEKLIIFISHDAASYANANIIAINDLILDEQ